MNQNSSPFSSLPYDIFRKIIFNAYAYTPEPEEYDEPLLLLDVVSPPILASHVCRSWRRALLSDPIMWTCVLIPKIKPNGIRELLRRSASALLDVFLKLKDHPNYDMDYVEMAKVLSSLFQKVHRFRILHMQVDPLLSEDQLEPDFVQALLIRRYLSQPAPNLQMFFFWCPDLHEIILDTLFSGNAPNLKHICHRFSASLKEISCPLFHDLSELHFSFPEESTMEFGLFLDFLKLSPRLVLLHVYIDSDRYDMSEIFKSELIEFYPDEPDSPRVNLPNLQMLVLEVNLTVDFVDLILENVTFPSSVKWQITSQYLLESVDSPQTLQLMSRAHFTCVRIWIAHGQAGRLSFEENTDPKNTIRFNNWFNNNKLMYLSRDMSDLMDIWGASTKSFGLSDLTSLVIYVELEYSAQMEQYECQVFPAIIASMSSLESLTIRYKHTPFFQHDQPSLSPLSELIPEDFTALEPSPEPECTRNLTQDLKCLALVDSEEELSSTNPNVITSAPSVCPCPHLRELYVELDGPLTETDVAKLCTCARRRREKGYPLRIFVRCVKVRGVESMRRLLQEDGDISVSVVPIAVEWDNL